MTRLLEQLTPAALASLGPDELVAISERLRVATERLEETQDADPELTALLRERVDEALEHGDIDEDTARVIAEELATTHPAIVFEARFEEIVEPHIERQRRKGVGAPLAAWTPLPEVHPEEEVMALAAKDPAAVVEAVTRQMARFVDDLDRVIDPAVEHAKACGIEESVFGPVIAHVIRELRLERRATRVDHL